MGLAPSSVFFGRFFIGFILCAQLLKLFSPTYFNYLYGSTSTNFAQVDVLVESTRSVIIPTSFRCRKRGDFGSLLRRSMAYVTRSR
ncbi:hypothetical protein Gotur_024142, partial [Gossypium turneri]